MDLTIITLNLWNINEPVKKRMEDLILFLQETRPDIMLIQEVSVYEDRLQSLYIKGKLNYLFHAYSFSGLAKKREEGIAILSNINPFEVYTYELKSSPGAMPRKLQVIRLHIKGSSYTIANTHLAYSIFASYIRKLQAKQIRDILAKWDNIVLGGDLNTSPNSKVLKILTSDSGLIDVGKCNYNGVSSDNTFSSTNPFVGKKMASNRRIDYFLVSKNLTVKDYKIVLRENDKHGVVSDHYGLLIKVRL